MRTHTRNQKQVIEFNLGKKKKHLKHEMKLQQTNINEKKTNKHELDILEYFFCWFASYSVNSRSRPNRVRYFIHSCLFFIHVCLFFHKYIQLVQSANNGSRFSLNLFSKQNENQNKPSSGHPSPTPFDLLALGFFFEIQKKEK